MKLKLSKEISFFDLETTGIMIGKDRIVSIAIIKVKPDGSREKLYRLVNPGMPIPAETTAIHGISDEDVKNEPGFDVVGKEVLAFLGNSDLAGYNSNKFDVPILIDEFYRVGIEFDMKGRRLVDVQNIFHKKEPRTLAGALKFYCDRDMVDAHNAEADIQATIDVFESQLEMYNEDENLKDINSIAKFSKLNRNVDFAGRVVLNDEDKEVFNFGKHKGRLVTDVFIKEPTYYSWMMKGDFPQETKQVITNLRLKAMNT
ncbi:MAG: 3'-5' exonuclease [Bacteroidia bacterium]|nr:3'-5' exonuclease [Bacteroidia bacterium]